MLQRFIVIVAFLAIGFGIYGLAGNMLRANTEAAAVSPLVVEEPEPEQIIPDIAVLRFKRDMQRADPIAVSDIEKVMMPADLAAQHGFTVYEDDGMPSVTAGSVVRHAIAANMPFDASLLVSPESSDYIELLIRPGFIPYAYLATTEAVYGGAIAVGDNVDIVSLTSNEQNLANGEYVNDFRQLTVRPLLQKRRVLHVEEPLVDGRRRTEVNVVLELTREDVAKMVIAKRIGLLELHKSHAGAARPEVDTGDVLPDFFSIKELRGSQREIN